MKIVTFATPEYQGIYKQYAGKSMKELSLPHILHCYPSQKSWVDGTNLKPKVILLELKKGNSVLYVDVDARITSREVMDIDKLVPKDCIAACYFLDWDKWAGGCSGIIEPLTGTMFFRPEAISLVELWCRACENSDKADGKVWQDVIEGRQDIFHLPIEYCYIYSLPNGNKGKIPCDKPFIIHYQESRNARC